MSIGADGLREVIQGPADLAGLDVGEIKELMVAEARDEPGALPLVENALRWLWQQRTNNRLSGRLFTDNGRLAGILIRSADAFAGFDAPQRDRALELLFRLVRVDREGSRHSRRSLPLKAAVKVAGGGETGGAVVHGLSGQRRQDGAPGEGPPRLITVVDGAVNLIHETLIRSKGLDAAGKPQPYWPTLWKYIEDHRQRAAWRERLGEDVAAWMAKGRSAGHLWSHERVREAAEALRPVVPELSDDERAFLGPIDPEAMLAELKDPKTAHRRRLLIGERLLGDPRRGVGVDAGGTPEIDWCSVPGGDVTISILSDPNDPYSKVEDRRPKEVEPFYVARYPVTVAQYRAFLDAEDGWVDDGWWAVDLYRDPDSNTYGVGQFGNHPAVYVNWFDAVAFCRWLSRRLHPTTVRLADEWEWQQAAIGGDAAKAFPWGDDWDPKQEPHRANTFESRLGGATAVGMYPDGASPTGVLDMAGTVWEWCSNKHGELDVTQSRADDFDPRVLRGGSWSYYQDGARSADRDRLGPSYRDSFIGFRVLCSSPILER